MKRLTILSAACLLAVSLFACNPQTPEPVNPSEGETEKPVDTPDTPDTPPTPPTPVVEPGLADAQWIFDADIAAGAAAAWQTDNKLPARFGDFSGAAYISTSAGSGEGPKRSIEGGRIWATSWSEDDAYVFTVPSQTLAAGSSVDFCASFYANSAASPQYWIFEYYDGNSWKSVEKDLYTVPGSDKKYSFAVKYFSAAQYTSFLQHFTLEHPIVDGELKMRCRVAAPVSGNGAVLSPNASAGVGFVNFPWVAAQVATYQGIPVKDTRRMLLIGNSFSYYYGPAYMLKEIARSQGHDLQVRAFIKGGQYFRDFQDLELAQNIIKEGGYELALLQDASMQHAYYFTDARSNEAVFLETKTLFDQVRSYSPAAQLILESTWSYSYQNYKGFGSFQAFDEANLNGSKVICDSLGAWLSPIGVAFKQAREAGITDLYHTDNHHPNRNGSYLKSCVNYLLLYGERFDRYVPDCAVDAKTAAKLRSIAEDVVLGHLEEYRHPDASGLTPGGGTGGEEGETVDGNHGIENAAQLVSWARRVNSGGDVSSYQDASGNVVLLKDIDLTGVDWPVVGLSGGSLAYNAKTVPSTAFSGVFDGKGHTIKGLHLVHESHNMQVTGFFGATSGATVRNVRFEDCTLDLSSAELTALHVAAGVVAAYAYDSVFENVHVSAAITGEARSASSIHTSLGGVVGTLFASSDRASAVQSCSFSGSIRSDIGVKYSNNNSARVGGVVGGVGTSSKLCLIKDCVNNAEIDVRTHRVGGIVCDAFMSIVEDCTNNGNITASHSDKKASSTTVKGVRAGGIIAYCTTTGVSGAVLRNCRNNGRIVTTEPSSAAGGVVGAIKCYRLEHCVNAGDVVCPEGMRGLLIGMINKNDTQCTVSGCALRGSIGAKTDGSDAVAANADNYLSLGVTLYNGAVCADWNASNVTYLAE